MAFRTLTTNRLAQDQFTTGQLLPFTINTIWDNPGARTKKVRVGRGPASGLGKNCGRGNKGMYHRAGGQVNKGFEGGQSGLHKRFPKLGFAKNRFNRSEVLTQLNLGQLAYHIEKGNIDSSKTIQMRDLLESGVVSKVGHGVKLLAKGAEKFNALQKPIQIEVSDASLNAIQAVKTFGGSVQVQYRTPLTLRYHLKPYKFDSNKSLKIPMPPNKSVKKLERIRKKGVEVSYPSAPWYTDNVDAINQEKAEKQKRIKEGQYSELLPNYPASRQPGIGLKKPRLDREDLPWKFKFPS